MLLESLQGGTVVNLILSRLLGSYQHNTFMCSRNIYGVSRIRWNGIRSALFPVH